MVAQYQGVFPKGKPVPYAQGHTVMPTCLRYVEETLVLVSGPSAGSSLSPRNASDGRVPHRLGSCHEGPPCPRSVERSPSHMAHQLLGDAGRVLSTETLSPGPKRSSCVGAHRQHNGGCVFYINHQGGLRSRPFYKLAHQILVWSQGKILSLRALQIPDHLNMGVDILSWQWPRVFSQVQVGLFVTRETSHCPLWLTLTHSAPLWLDAMVQTWPRLHLSTPLELWVWTLRGHSS